LLATTETQVGRHYNFMYFHVNSQFNGIETFGRGLKII